jgi:hypothetical protein
MIKKDTWKDSLSLKKPVPSGYRGEMPLRNQKKDLIPSNSLAINSRVTGVCELQNVQGLARRILGSV